LQLWIGPWLLIAAMQISTVPNNLNAQQKYDEQHSGAIQTFPWPTAQSDDIAIARHRKTLRAEVSISSDMSVRFYELPTSVMEYNSTISVYRGRRVIATYAVGQMIRDQALRLVHLALLHYDDAGTVVAEYEGGGVGAREGFAILHFSSEGVKLHTLPLSDYGKVVVFRNDPNYVKVWSASLNEDMSSPVADRAYLTRVCHWHPQGFLCDPPKREPGVFTPGGISDPGIEIR